MSEWPPIGTRAEGARPTAGDPARPRGIWRWLDTLFARIFLLQVAVSMVLVAVLALMRSNDQAHTFARGVAPPWVSALGNLPQSLAQGGEPGLPRTEFVTTPITLLPGPLPSNATLLPAVPLAPRYRALLAELRERGVPVQRMAVSGSEGQVTFWLSLRGRADTPTWVGLQGAPGVLEAPDLRRRSALALMGVLVVFLVAAAWLSRRIVKPLLDLRRRVDHFARTGEKPLDVPSSGPAEVRELSQQFHDFATQRAHRDEERNMMLAGLSHDLRSPLGRIRLAAELLPDLPEWPGLATKRESIVRNAQLADQLVGSFLALVRADAEPMDERVDLAALVQRWWASGDHEGVQLDLQSQGPLWLATASTVALERALTNLLDNAVKYGRAPVVVTLQALLLPRAGAAGPRALEARLSVRDHGDGVPLDQVDKLLKPFYRGAHDRGLPGSGLGLPIVAGIVKRHGGQLDLVDAHPGLAVVMRWTVH
jgi:two-component system, OmpR family, osmolarity sensor histidine kinase EnvZ